MKKMNVHGHTDLALEMQEEFEHIHKIDGVSIRKKHYKRKGIRESVISIDNKKGEELFGKPKGLYITLEYDGLRKDDLGYHKEMSELIYHHLKKMLGNYHKILVAGLGNRKVTPDALGPLVMDHLFITGHVKHFSRFSKYREILGIAPGVMAQTGMETGKILKGIIGEEKPEVLLVIDALAAKSLDRLNTTIQICDTGIYPGSGVGNKRKEITRQTMGIPVIAIGVPTVISMPAVAAEITDSFVRKVGKEKIKEKYENWSEEEKYYNMADIIGDHMYELFVTPKEIDESVNQISFTVSEGINKLIFCDEITS